MHATVDLKDVGLHREHGGLSFHLRIPRFVVRAGEFVALVGDSGSGKSTFLDVLGLILRPSVADRFKMRVATGEQPEDILTLWRRGEDGRLAALRRAYLGYVLQTGGLLPFLTVEGNLKLPLLMNGLSCDRDELLRATERFGVAQYLGRRPELLSGGERQRVAVLRAMMHRPLLVLADEPTAAVDKSRARAIVADFRKFARELGSAIVMVTHDLDLVREAADTTYQCTLSASSKQVVEAVCAPL
jgi:putative ABC transport system ATP-binding protein